MRNFDDGLLRSFLRYDEDGYLSDDYDDEIPLGPRTPGPRARRSPGPFSVSSLTPAGRGSVRQSHFHV